MHATITISDADEAKIYYGLAKAVTRLAGTVIKDPYINAVLQFATDRTFGFRKLSEEIPERHFLNGVTSKAKGITCAGLNMKRAKLYACIRWLREQGIIVTQKMKRKVRYAISLKWVLSLVSSKLRAVLAPALKFTDDKWGSEGPREQVHSMDVSGREYVHGVDIHIKEQTPSGGEEKTKSARELAPDAGSRTFSFSNRAEADTIVVPPAAASVPADPPVAPVPASTNAKRQKMPEEINVWALFRCFEDAARRAWPDMGLLQEPSGKLRGQWRNTVAIHWNHPRVSLPDFLRWCATNWRAVYRGTFKYAELRQAREDKKKAEFGWAPDTGWCSRLEFPEYPDFGFLFAYRAAFLKEYDNQNTHRLRAGISTRDNLIHKFRYKGFRMEEAEAEADRWISKRSKREDLDKRARELAQAARRLKDREQSLDTRLALARGPALQPVATGKNPIRVPSYAPLTKPVPSLAFQWKDEG